LSNNNIQFGKTMTNVTKNTVVSDKSASKLLRAPIPSEPSRLQWVDIPFDAEHPIAFGINVYPNRTECHFDIHLGLEIGICLAGAGRRWFGAHSFEVEPGKVWFAGLWEPHGFEVTKPKARHMVMQIMPEFIDTPEPFTSFDWTRIFKVSPDRRPNGETRADREFTLAYAKKMLATVQRTDDPNWLIRARLLLQEFILYYSERIGESHKTSYKVEPFHQRQKLLPALILLEQRRCQDISIIEAARAAHMGRSSFSQMFRSAVGVSFGKYCQRRRLAGAICDLRSTDLKLAAIAQRWGFCDAAHFVRLFKVSMRMTPSEYRQYWLDSTSGRKKVLKALPVPSVDVPMFQENIIHR
jgi:AraC-like DNA-binding protein/mannose-6-phosphate isomerase-like protein (cupin superfamily)